MKKRDIVLVSVLSCGAAAVLFAVAAYLYVRRRRRKREDEDGSRHAIRADPSSSEDGLLKNMNRLNGFLNLKTPLISTKTLGNFWNCFVSIVVLMNRAFVTNSTSVLFGDMPLFLHIISVILELIIIFDIYIQLKTGYIDKESRKIVFDAKSGLLRYASRKLFFHSLAAIPVQTVQMIRYGSDISCTLCKANRFTCALRFFSIFGLYRLYDSTYFWVRGGRSFKVIYFFKFLRICILGIVTTTQYVNLSWSFNLLMIINQGKIEENSHFALLLRVKFWNVTDLTSTEFVFLNLAKIIKRFFLFGYSYSMLFYLDKLFALIGNAILSIYMLWGFMEVFAVVNRQMFAEDVMHTKRDRTLNMMKCMQLSDRVSEKVLDYYHFNMSRQVVTEITNEIYRSLPTSILKDIKVTAYTRLVKRISYFNDWPIQIIEDLVMLLKEEVYLADDVVSHTWCTGEGLIIVETGVLAVYAANHVESGHLIDGDYFGVLSLVTDKEIRNSSVVATTRCKILLLDKRDFRFYMQLQPELFFSLRRRLRRDHQWKYPDDTHVGSRHKI